MKKLMAGLIALCMVSGSALTAQALTAEEIQDAVKTYGPQFEKLYNKQNHKQIVKDGEKLVQNGDDKAKFVAWYYLSESYSALGDKKKTLAALDHVKELDSDGLFAPVLATAPLLRIGEQEKALNDCLKGARKASGDKREQRERVCRDTVADFNKVSASKIWKAFNENEVAAEDQYKNKLIAVEGKISKISTSITGAPEVTMNVDQYGMQTVTFAFPKDARAEIAKMKKGKKMKIAGLCRGFFMGLAVHFTECWIPE